MQISDRVLVLYNGQIMGRAGITEITLEEIGLMMAGHSLEEYNHEMQLDGYES